MSTLQTLSSAVKVATDAATTATAQANIATLARKAAEKAQTQVGADAGSAEAAATVAREINNRLYPGTYAADPIQRPDGSPMQNGDVAMLTSGVMRVRIAGAWQDWTTASGAAAAAAAAAAATSEGLAADYALKTAGTVEGAGTYSAKEYAQGAQAGAGGSAKNWAQQTGADVTGAAAGSRSAKSWSQEDLTGATGGSAKDWAQSGALPDGVNKSAKSYAIDAKATKDYLDGRIYPGTYAADPLTRPDGTARVDGDICFTTGNVPKVYGGGVWAIIAAPSAADLANSADPAKGAALIGYDGASAQAVLDSAKPMANYTALRAYVGRATSVRITSANLAGFFYRDDADAATADNGGTVIVSANGKRWKRLFVGFVSVVWFGANPSGAADDTAAFAAAFTASPFVTVPAGVFNYNGNGISTPNSFSLMGAGRDLTTINIAAGKYFISSPNLFAGIVVTGVKFLGGAGALQNTSTAANGGTPRKVIHDCEFRNYTRCAVESNQGDGPYWDIQRNRFYGANVTTTIGVALARNSDVSVIRDNEFLLNKVHLKLNTCGLVPDISGNDFIQFAGGNQRVSIWICGDNSNQSDIYVYRNKFGNENLDATDYRIAVVPELAGALNGDRLPDFATLAMAAGKFRLDVSENGISGGAGNIPIVYSVSGELRGSRIANNILGGSLPSYMLQYGQAVFTDNPIENILFGENYSENAITVAPVTPCNLGYYGAVVDPRHVVEGDSRYPNSSLSANAARVGYVELLGTRIRNFGLATATKIADIVDATGGTDAAEFSVVNAAEIYAAWTIPPTPGEVLWIECDLAQGSATPTAQIGVQIYSAVTTAPAYYQRRCKVSSANWKTFRFPGSVAGAQASRFKFIGLGAGQIKIGRVRVYHSRSPVPHGQQTFDTVKLASTATAKTSVPAGQVWVDAANKSVLKLSDGVNEQASSGQLSDKQVQAVAVATPQLLWRLGFTSGFSNLVFTVAVTMNRNTTGQCVRREFSFSASGTGGTPNSVAAVGAVTNALVMSDNVAADFTLTATVVAGKLEISAIPTTNVGNFQASGRWSAPYIGTGGTMVTEN